MRTSICVATAFCCFGFSVADEPDASHGLRQPTGSLSLQDWQVLVGRWRGVGQIRRGSTLGAWQENGQWAWQHQTGHPSVLTYQSEDGRYVRGATLKVVAPDRLELTMASQASDGKSATGKTQRYVGRTIDKRLVLERVADPSNPPGVDGPNDEAPNGDSPERMTLRTVANGNRLLVLLERRNTVSLQWQRMAEVGYTRVGSQFGKGTAEIQCIVTGGKGTIPVTYQGKTYYVCCSGCRDYFQEYPEKVLAEWRTKQAKDPPKQKLGK